jgi:hypothetical protein
MPYKFNPFTNALDYFESGGGGGASYIDGEVATYTDLPLDGSAALNTAWLVRQASGTWLIARKPAGIYIRTATAGVSRDADYTYAGILPDVFSDANFLLYDNADSSKNLAFQLSGIPTGTTRTVDAPAGNGRMLVEGQSIGGTTAAAGTFTTLTANNGTLTASAPVLDLSQTWNASGTTFTGLRLTITDTASATDSALFRIRIGTNERFIVNKAASGGTTTRVLAGEFFAGISDLGVATGAALTTFGIRARSDGNIGFVSGTDTTAGNDVTLRRDAANTLALQNTTNAQTFNIYNTFTSATNHERGFLRWSSNVFQIGTEKGSGGGTARQMDFQIDGTNFLSVRSNGVRTTGLTNHVGNTDSVAQIGFGQFSFNAGGANNSGGILFYDGNGGGVSTRLGLDANNVLAIKSGTAAQAFRIYNTTTWERLNIRWASNECIIDTEAGGTGTLRGIKIGSATSSLLGFYGVTPVDQPATVADPAGGGTVDAEARTAVNAIIDRLQELGLIA